MDDHLLLVAGGKAAAAKLLGGFGGGRSPSQDSLCVLNDGSYSYSFSLGCKMRSFSVPQGVILTMPLRTYVRHTYMYVRTGFTYVRTCGL